MEMGESRFVFFRRFDNKLSSEKSQSKGNTTSSFPEWILPEKKNLLDVKKMD